MLTKQETNFYQNINRSIGNEWFRTKISSKITDKSGYIDSKYPIAKSLVEKYKNNEKPFWTKEDIDSATNEACRRITDFIFEQIPKLICQGY